eukprot:4842596-Pyramimonas_sp.AAC.1
MSPTLTEVHQESDTRREVREGVIRHTARLDRIYTTLPQAYLRDYDVRCGVVGRLQARSPSDHIPVFATLSPFTPSKDFPSIPKRIAAHPEFSPLLEALVVEFDAHTRDLSAWDRLEAIKALMFVAAQQVRELVK